MVLRACYATSVVLILDSLVPGERQVSGGQTAPSKKGGAICFRSAPEILRCPPETISGCSSESKLLRPEIKLLRPEIKATNKRKLLGP
eukprot:3939581-Rhodomonas_salina.1